VSVQTIILTQALACFFLMNLTAAPPEFRAHTLATDLKGGYQVVPVDMNHDGKIDLIALASGMTDLVWFENPTWERHVIASNLPHMINLAAWDTDGDGIPEIALASEFSMRAKDSIGIVSVLKHNGDPRQPWPVTEIDRLSTSHRLRWADIDGSGKKVLVNAPLIGEKGEAPDYRDRVPLVYYRPGEWKRRLIDDRSERKTSGIRPRLRKAIRRRGPRVEAATLLSARPVTIVFSRRLNRGMAIKWWCIASAIQRGGAR
jgi:VCBS repeat protein